MQEGDGKCGLGPCMFCVLQTCILRAYTHLWRVQRLGRDLGVGSGSRRVLAQRAATR